MWKMSSTLIFPVGQRCGRGARADGSGLHYCILQVPKPHNSSASGPAQEQKRPRRDVGVGPRPCADEGLHECLHLTGRLQRTCLCYCCRSLWLVQGKPGWAPCQWGASKKGPRRAQIDPKGPV